MKKKLYYSVEKEIADDGETLNGNKTITVYSIINSVPQKIFTIEGSLEDKTTDLILNYLDDNGFGDDEFEMILL